MSQNSQIHLKTSSILTVPIHSYEDDFVFIVNGEEFKTNRLTSELISPKISQLHITDPTNRICTIDTQSKGDFSIFLQLVSFNNLPIPENELEFIIEVIDKLGNESIEIAAPNQSDPLTNENVLSLLKLHQQHEKFYTKIISNEIDYISSNFYEIVKTEEIETLPQFIINQIISNEHLKLEDEDQLLTFINKLYQSDRTNCDLYEYVNFSNLSLSGIQKFLSIFDIYDLSQSIWLSISQRLQNEIKLNKSIQKNSERYIKKLNENFAIFEELRNEANGENPITANLVSVSASSSHYGQPSVLVDNDPNKRFETKDARNSYICFDFKSRKVSLTGYSMRTHSILSNGHIAGWILLGSNDSTNWEPIDEVENTDIFRTIGSEGRFTLKKESDSYQYIKLVQNKQNTKGFWNLRLSSIEFFGSIHS